VQFEVKKFYTIADVFLVKNSQPLGKHFQKTSGPARRAKDREMELDPSSSLNLNTGTHRTKKISRKMLITTMNDCARL